MLKSMIRAGVVTKALPLMWLGLAGCASSEAPGRALAPVVYGVDDRQDVYAHPSASLRALAHESIVALIRSTRLEEQTDGSYERLPTLTLGEALDLCSDQRFIDQPTSASCSGTLVAPDIVLTAGHCMEKLSQCLNTSLVFDYLYTAEGVLAPLEANDVYGCVEILSRENGVLDYAYLRLDRNVVGHSPATLSPGVGNTCLNVVDEEAVSVLGFGSALPLKIDSGGVVIAPSAAGPNFFLTSLDTFGGNSGSGVFNASGQLVGVLSGGLPDYRQRPGDTCTEVNVLPELDGGEVIGHVLPTLVRYCDDASAPNPALCAVAESACGEPGPDAGMDPDAGMSPDAGFTDDAGSDAATSDMGGPHRSGSSCAVSIVSRGGLVGGHGAWPTLLLLALCWRRATRSRRVRPLAAPRCV